MNQNSQKLTSRYNKKNYKLISGFTLKRNQAKHTILSNIAKSIPI